MSTEVQLYKGDIYIENGQVRQIVDEEKLIQQMSKLLMTQKGGFFHPEYGSNIYTLIGKAQTPDVLEPLAEDHVRTEIGYYQSIQRAQELMQDMSNDEVVLRVLKVTLTLVATTAFKLDMDVMNRRGAFVNVSSIQGY